MAEVFLKCINVGKKLRVQIISPGYNNDAFCQFPTILRVDGRKYRTTSRFISVANGPRGKFFYRVRGDISVVEENEVLPEHIYSIPECCICLENQPKNVMIPCGHLCICDGCVVHINGQKRCPMCRQEVASIIDSSELL